MSKSLFRPFHFHSNDWWNRKNFSSPSPTKGRQSLTLHLIWSTYLCDWIFSERVYLYTKMLTNESRSSINHSTKSDSSPFTKSVRGNIEWMIWHHSHNLITNDQYISLDIIFQLFVILLVSGFSSFWYIESKFS